MKSKSLLPFEEHARDAFAGFNDKQLARSRIEVLARAIEEVEGIAREEKDDASEKVGRFEQNLRRLALRFSKMVDGTLSVKWLEPDWENVCTLELRRRVMDHIQRRGAEQDAQNVSELRVALKAVANGKSLPALGAKSLAFAKAIGSEPLEQKKRKGGPIPNEAVGDVTFALACIFHELTGRDPGYSSTGETPEGTFRDFADRWAGGLETDDFRLEVISERRLRDAVRRWNRERVSFSRGDSLDRLPHLRWTKKLAKAQR